MSSSGSSSESSSTSSSQSASPASVRDVPVTSSQGCFPPTTSAAVTSSQGVSQANPSAIPSCRPSSSVAAATPASVTSSQGSSPAIPAAAVTSSWGCSPGISSQSADVRARPVATVKAVISAPHQEHVTLSVCPLKAIVVHDSTLPECTLKQVSIPAVVSLQPTSRAPLLSNIHASSSASTALPVRLVV